MTLFEALSNTVFQASFIGYVLALLLSMGFGMVWYGPIFGEVWCQAQGIDTNDKKKMKSMQEEGKQTMVFIYIHCIYYAVCFFVCSFLYKDCNHGNVCNHDIGCKLFIR